MLELSMVSFLTKYKGAMPGTKPLWKFRGHGEGLCIYGIYLTSVSSHFAPGQTDTTGIGPRMLSSVLHDALSGMTDFQRQTTTYYVDSLVAVLRTDTYRNVEVALRNWWRILRESTDMSKGIDWFGGMLSNDKELREGHHLLASTLVKEGLSVARCKSAALCYGGLAFAGAAVHDGDAVFLVSGVSYPLVLRPCGAGRFKLIGPLFLPGVMNGELQEKIKGIPLDEIMLV